MAVKESAHLFSIATEILRHEGIGKEKWSFGGGTALMTYFNHRLSKDIDITIYDAQFIGNLTPRLNDFIASKTNDYREMSHFIKLRFKEGDVDFILAPFLTKNPIYTTKDFSGATINIESPEEIVIKKIFYGADVFKLRDFFDLAVVIKHREKEMMHNLDVYYGKLSALEKRLNLFKSKGFFVEKDVLNIIDMKTAKQTFHIVEDFIKTCEEKKLSRHSGNTPQK
ncbi:MAG: hypothetical protein DDT19_00018 [Syntrophomonadaceae bacterium]|nr:hypothetical protein [Bacillota bacterium]